MPAYDSGIVMPYNSVNAGVIPADVYGISIDWFVNRTPLYARLPKAPLDSLSFKITSDQYRPRTGAVGSNYTSGGGTLAVTDGSQYTVGDVLQVESEFFLVTAISGNNLTVTGAYAGTSAANHASAVAVYTITNTRTGGEVDQNAISRIPVTVEQHAQTIQHPYQVSGSLQSAGNYVSGFGSPLQRDKLMAMQHVVDDFESASYYGRGVGLAALSTRPAMKGLKTLLTTNNTTSPTNGSSYGPDDLIRDTVQKVYDQGGMPSVLVVSTNFLTGLSIWGHNVQRLEAGATVFGTPIDVFAVSFLPGVSIVPAPLLRPGTAICLAGSEVRIREKRRMFDKPRGSRGDAEEGDIIAEGAIEVDNEHHHAWVEGITAFAA